LENVCQFQLKVYKIIYLQNTVPRGDAIPFEIKGVTVGLANYEIENETI
jgi:hypothetical protein